MATYHLPVRDIGEYAITATYNGDANCQPSVPASLVQTVRAAQTTIALNSSSNPTVFGSTASLKAVVKAVAPGHGAPTGSITFSEGATTLATVSLNNGSATYFLGALNAEEHTVTATYVPESKDFVASASQSINQIIERAATKLTLTRSANPAKAGSEAYVKATLKPFAPGTGVPGGFVTFSEGQTTLGVILLEGGDASFRLERLRLANTQ